MILNVSWCLSYPKHPQTTRLKTTRLSPAKKSPDRSPAQADPRGRHPRCRCLSASETGKRCRDHAEGQNQRSNGQTVKPRTCGTNHPNPLQTSTHKRLYHGTSVLLQHAPVVTDFFFLQLGYTQVSCLSPVITSPKVLSLVDWNFYMCCSESKKHPSEMTWG